jgi:DNA-binding Xre family transcriptional regulator
VKGKRRMGYRWHLRRLMVERDMYSTTDLMPHLEDRGILLSAAQVYRLVVHIPERLNLNTLVALCDILDVAPGDLIEPVVESEPARKTAAARGSGQRARGRKPTRARIAKRR